VDPISGWRVDLDSNKARYQWSEREVDGACGPGDDMFVETAKMAAKSHFSAVICAPCCVTAPEQAWWGSSWCKRDLPKIYSSPGFDQFADSAFWEPAPALSE
jgi:hypothetical protein